MKRKKFRNFLLASGLLLSEVMGFAAPAVMAEDASSRTDKSTVDFVLVLDQSGSLDANEKELLLDAAHMFIDMLPSENTRLSAITFGDRYGDEAFNITSPDFEQFPTNCSFVKEVYELNDITDMENRDIAKECIDRGMEKKAQVSNIGFGLQAACETLINHGAVDGNAAVILLSDGEGYTEVPEGNNDKYSKDGSHSNFHSIDYAVKNLRYEGWPVYAMELDFDKNAAGHYQMEEVIANGTDGENIAIMDPEAAEKAFTGIFEKFYDVDPECVTNDSQIIQNGRADFNLSIGEMVAESTIVLTGEAGAIEKVEITRPNGKSEEYRRRQTTERIDKSDENNTLVTFEGAYANVKLFSPQDGNWTITTYGTDDVQIDMYAVSIREMDLQISSDRDDGSIFPKRGKATFTAKFSYKDHEYNSEGFYNKCPANLIIEQNGTVIDSQEMEAVNQNGITFYQKELTFNNNGTYKVYAEVKSPIFRDEAKKSGTYEYTISNTDCKLIEGKQIQDYTANFNTEIKENLTAYFIDEDLDPVLYSVKITPQDDNLTVDEEALKNGSLVLKVGDQEADYDVKVEGTDGQQDVPAVQNFKVSVVNQVMEVSDELKSAIESGMEFRFTYNADNVPAFLLKMIGVPTESQKVIDWNRYCTDADGTEPVVEVKAVESSDVIQSEMDGNTTTFVATGAGNAVYNVTLTDAGSKKVQYKVEVKVSSWDAWALIWKTIQVPFITISVLFVIAVVFLLLAYAGRNIYGVWEIRCNGEIYTNKKFSATDAGKKSSCNLDEILHAFKCPTGFPNVKIAATNNFTKGVIIKGKGLDKCASIKYKRRTSKKNSFIMDKGASLMLTNSKGYEVEIIRKK